MDDINNNDNDHNTLTDGSDSIALSNEMPSGLVSVTSANSAPSLGIQTQAPQHVTNVTLLDVNSAIVGSSQYIDQGLHSPTSKSLSSLIGEGSKTSFQNHAAGNAIVPLTTSTIETCILIRDLHYEDAKLNLKNIIRNDIALQ